MTALWSQELYIKSWLFATKAHESINQKFSGTTLPYNTHIALVCSEVMAVAHTLKDPNLGIVCANLHDVVEDAGMSYLPLIQAEFGDNAANGVLALSKNPEIKDKRVALIDSLDRIDDNPDEVGATKMADRITNLLPPPSHWKQDQIKAYLDDSYLIYDRLGKKNDLLGQRLAEKIENYKTYIIG